MKIYIVKTIVINGMEPSHYSSHEWETIEGIYASEASALDKMKELNKKHRQSSIKNPDWYYIEQRCTITEHELIP